MMKNGVAVIIQARMTSTRLPGKVLMEVMGKPLLSYQIERLRFCKMIDKIIIATTVNKEDDLIVELCQKAGLDFYRGSEHDVLGRYYQTAKKYKLKHVMRLTADCPLIDSGVCDRIVSAYFKSGVDYIRTGETFAEGLDCEILGFNSLAKAWLEAKQNAEREHVTLYVNNHPEFFKIMVQENEVDDSKYRITVDEEKDFLVVKAILENLYKGPDSYFTVREIKSYLDAHSNIYRLNSHIIRNEGLVKSLKSQRINRVLIRTDASNQIGTGHVMRCLTLASELCMSGVEVVFVCREFEGNLCDYIEKKGYYVERLPVPDIQGQNIQTDFKYATWLGDDWQNDAKRVEDSIKGFNVPFDWLIVDHYALDERWERCLRPFVKKIMVIDDLANRPHDCDLLLDQNFYANLESRYDDLVVQHCKKLLGPKYALLRPEFREEKKKLRERDGNVKRIMIFFGGSDQSDEVLKILKVIKEIRQADISVDIVMGMNNLGRKPIEAFVASNPNIRCHVDVNNMAELMGSADLFIGSAGITTWERCCLGLPSLVITIAENQEKATIDLAKNGVLHYLGKSEQMNNVNITKIVNYYLCNPSLLLDYSNASMNLVDGKGAVRCVNLLNDHVCQSIWNSDKTEKFLND